MKKLFIICGLLVMGCTANQEAKVQQVEQELVKIDKAMVVNLCKANPAAVNGLAVAQGLVMDPKAQAGMAGAVVALSIEAKICKNLGLL